MAQQFDVPKNEIQLRQTLDELYRMSKEAKEKGERPAFKGLVEIMASDVTIMTAIHNLKSNHGSETPGVDGKTMRVNYLHRSPNKVIKEIKEAFNNFVPCEIRRVYIDKPGKTEKRPLGIPVIRDRIVQECMRIVLEPIMEAQFYEHSYGFRPMREASMALERITSLTYMTGYHWIVEGDISKCFDRIDHHILLKRLYHMGIKDRRVIQIVKTMLKAGIMGECVRNEMGTPQGGIISPLLANVYLDMLDSWVSKQWHHKETQYSYASQCGKIGSLTNRTKLIPGYIIRYADDFIICTDTKEHAESWKTRLATFLQDELKLELSVSKTLITNVRKRYVKFLGFEFKDVKGKGRKGYVTRTKPDEDRVKAKIEKIIEDIKSTPKKCSREGVIAKINLINSQIRGIINYYQCCTRVNPVLESYSYHVRSVAYRLVRRYKGKWIRAKKVQNLPRIHCEYKTKIPAIKYGDIWIGVTDLAFSRWERSQKKNQNETPYTSEGRELNFQKTKKARARARLDDLFCPALENVASRTNYKGLYNYEFVMNRMYALNRDRLKCRVCGGWLIDCSLWTHRINPNLPLNKVNRVDNLISVHRNCFLAINDPSYNLGEFDKATVKKIMSYRKKLGCTYHTATINRK